MILQALLNKYLEVTVVQKTSEGLTAYPCLLVLDAHRVSLGIVMAVGHHFTAEPIPVAEVQKNSLFKAVQRQYLVTVQSE